MLSPVYFLPQVAITKASGEGCASPKERDASPKERDASDTRLEFVAPKVPNGLQGPFEILNSADS